MRRTNRSRLKRRLENQTKKTLMLSIIGILVVFIALIKFGLPLLANLSLTISDSKNQDETTKKENNSFIAPPVLNPLFDATNSAKISISGIASSKQTVNLYLNNKLIDKSEVKKDNTFEFQEVSLENGENIIKTKVLINNDKQSDFSNSISVIFKKDAPKLSIDSPSDGQSFSKDENSINITGKTDPGAKVTVNDFWAIVDEGGNFSYKFTLKNGENKINVVSIDDAGNKTEINRKVNYSP